MLQLNTEMKVVSLPTRDDYFTMIRHIRDVNSYTVNMTGISEKEEEAIDDNKVLFLDRGGCTFEVSVKNIICYGEIDFNKNSDDFYELADLEWCGNDSMRGVDIPARYDYPTHTCKTPVKCIQTFDTMRFELVAQYAHGFLGKPKRVAIFKTKVYGSKKL